MLETEEQRQALLERLGDVAKGAKGAITGAFEADYAEGLGVSGTAPALLVSSRDVEVLGLIDGDQLDTIETATGRTFGPFTIRRQEPEGEGAMVRLVLIQS